VPPNRRVARLCQSHIKISAHAQTVQIDNAGKCHDAVGAVPPVLSTLSLKITLASRHDLCLNSSLFLNNAPKNDKKKKCHVPHNSDRPARDHVTSRDKQGNRCWCDHLLCRRTPTMNAEERPPAPHLTHRPIQTQNPFTHSVFPIPA
jgi:hypothetical protein